MKNCDHLKRSEVPGFRARTLEPSRFHEIWCHLLEACPICDRRLKEGWPASLEVSWDESAYARAVDRALERAQAMFLAGAAAREEGEALWAALRREPPGRRLTVVQSSRRHCTAAVLRAILGEVRDTAWQEPVERLELAELGVAVARRLDERAGAPWIVADLLAEALALASHAHCLMARFDEAERLLIEAGTWTRRGTGEPLVEALVLGTQGIHYLARRRFRRAERLLARAERLYREVGQSHLASRMLVQRASAIGHLHPEQGVRLTRRALGEMEVEVEPGLELEAVHQLSWCLCDAGRPREARWEMERHAVLYLRSGQAMASFSRYWLLGRIHRALEEFEDAERLFGRAWLGFVEIDARLPLTMLALDVAELRAARGDLRGAAGCLAETLLLARAWGVQRESLVILRLLRRVVAAGGGERSLFRRAALALRRTWD
jgi:tetratricopeptide (TPR) repeat protein